jgi:hypothetical protein
MGKGERRGSPCLPRIKRAAALRKNLGHGLNLGDRDDHEILVVTSLQN